MNSIDQFVQDYTLVIDNDQDAYNEVKDIVTRYKFDHNAIAHELQRQYDEAMAQAIETTEASETVTDLMRQLLLGWGLSAFDRIATHYIEMFQA